MKFLFFFCLIFGVQSVWGAADYPLIDAFAKDMRPLRNVSELESLTKRLTRSFKTDEEKARAILAWIVFNIDYDVYRAGHEARTDIRITFNIQQDSKTGQPYIADADVDDFFKDKDTTPQTLKTRLGICKDIAKLYQKMGEYAGLEVASISGFACEPGSEFEGHMWNAVKINGVWKYVDPTWAILGKRNNQEPQERIFAQMQRREYENALAQRSKYRSTVRYARENRSVGDEWFLTDENKMIQTHFPLERQWQLQKKRVVFEDFLRQRCNMTLNDFLNKYHAK